MKLLVLGGTEFLGRAFVEAALARGHDVTLFNRGRSNPHLFPGARRLRGDREAGDIAALAGGAWESVIDLTGYEPDQVRASNALLAEATRHYVFVSSISAYADLSRPPREDAALADDDDYGGKKARCEAEVERMFAGAALVIRPGLIVGPHDPTGRFTYWVHRIARGGDVLAPGDPTRQIQFIDARDLGEWMLDLVERRGTGTFNASHSHTMGELLETCRRVLNRDANLVWVPDEFLLEQGAGQWMELPLWIASADYAGMLAAETSRARAAGLRERPLEDTLRATLEHAEPKPEAGLAPERERELLAAWAARAG